MPDLPGVTGLDSVKSLFEKVPREFKKRGLRKMAGAGATTMRDAVRAATPVGKGPTRKKGIIRPPGTLKQSAFRYYARRQSGDTQAVFVVTYRKKTGYYASWVDQGHKIVTRKSVKNPGTIRSRRSSSSRVVPPHPFFEQAVTGAATRTAQTMGDAGQSEARVILRELGVTA